MKQIRLNTQHIEALLFHEVDKFALLDTTTGDEWFTSEQTKKEVIDQLMPIMTPPREGEPDIFEIHELYGQIDFVMERDLGEDVPFDPHNYYINRFTKPLLRIFGPKRYVIAEQGHDWMTVVDTTSTPTTIYSVTPDYTTDTTLILEGVGTARHLVAVLPYLIDGMSDGDILDEIEHYTQKRTWKVMLPTGAFVLMTAAEDTMRDLFQLGKVEGFEEMTYRTRESL